jgi:DNA adenine methylase
VKNKLLRQLMTMTKNRRGSDSGSGSLLRYVGSKRKAIPVLAKLIPRGTKRICSPFFGGGAFELHCAQQLGIEVDAYDAFDPLIIFWQQAQKNPQELQRTVLALRGHMNKQFFRKLQIYLCENPSALKQNPVKIAAIYYVLNRCAHSGVACSGGFSPFARKHALTDSVIAKIALADLSRIHFKKLDFRESIARTPASQLLFLDPPYVLEGRYKTNLYGPRGALNRDFPHEELFRLLQKRRKWILTYNNVPYIRKLYKGHRIIELDWRHRVSRGHFAARKETGKKELVILSSDLG